MNLVAKRSIRGWFILFIYLFGVLRRFQHCTGHIMTGSWMGRGNQYIEFARVLYCKLPTNSKQLPAFPQKALRGIEPRPQRWEARVLPLCHRGPLSEVGAICGIVPEKPLEGGTIPSGVRSPSRPYVGKLVVACHWSAVYSTEP